MTNDNHHSPEDERTIQFLSEMMTGDDPVPPDLQTRMERFVRRQIVRRRTLGWKATGSVSLAAGLVLFLSSGGDASMAYAGLVGVSVSLYGVFVRKMIAQTA